MKNFSAYKSTRGNITALANHLGITKGAVWQWGDKVPAERVLDVEAFTKIPREVLRPDIFGEVAA